MPENIVSQVEIDDFDTWLNAPGSENIITQTEDDKKKTNSKPNFFTNPSTDMSFLEENEEEDEVIKTKEELEAEEAEKAKLLKPDEINQALDNLDDEESEEEKNKGGRTKTDKSGLVSFLKKRIEANEMVAFDDYDEEKDDLQTYLESLSEKDIDELWTANIENIKSSVQETAPVEFFESLPPELQYAAKYAQDGGQDMKGLFKALAQVEEVRELDPEDENDQIQIVRSYLVATRFGDESEIEEEIDSWKNLGTIAKKAQQFKPKLDNMQEQQVAAKLIEQEETRKRQEAASKAYADNVFEALRTGEINGIKLDKKVQASLYTGLVKPQYNSISGRPTNLLGHLLEKYQFVEPNYALIAEAVWLLSNPSEYKAEISKNAKNAAVEEVSRKLKTEASKKNTNNQMQEEKDNKVKLPRNNNFFKRNL